MYSALQNRVLFECLIILSGFYIPLLTGFETLVLKVKFVKDVLFSSKSELLNLKQLS
jgi:hypothetical protein